MLDQTPTNERAAIIACGIIQLIIESRRTVGWEPRRNLENVENYAPLSQSYGFHHARARLAQNVDHSRAHMQNRMPEMPEIGFLKAARLGFVGKLINRCTAARNTRY